MLGLNSRFCAPTPLQSYAEQKRLLFELVHLRRFDILPGPTYPEYDSTPPPEQLRAMHQQVALMGQFASGQPVPMSSCMTQ